MIKMLISGLLAAAVATGATAAEGDITSLTVRTIATIGSPFALHQAGNFEVTFDGLVTLPLGVHCDSVYFTTNRINDPDRLIFTMLREAKELKLKVGVRVSDAIEPYPGRCSIIAAGYPVQ